MLRESPLRRHRRSQRISRPGERYQEGIPLGVDLLPISLGERVTEEPLVFGQDLCADALALAVGPLLPGGELRISWL